MFVYRFLPKSTQSYENSHNLWIIMLDYFCLSAVFRSFLPALPFIPQSFCIFAPRNKGNDPKFQVINALGINAD